MRVGRGGAPLVCCAPLVVRAEVTSSLSMTVQSPAGQPVFGFLVEKEEYLFVHGGGEKYLLCDLNGFEGLRLWTDPLLGRGGK